MSRRLYVSICALTALVCLFAAIEIRAQQLGSVIAFQETIATDEGGEKLFLPSSVFSDHVTDELYLIDGKGRITIFNAELFPLHTIGRSAGVETPQGLTVGQDGTLYVAQAASVSNRRHRITVFSPCLKRVREIYLAGFDGADAFIPSHLAIDSEENLYVAATSFPGVVVLDSSGRFREIISPEEDGRKAVITNVLIDSDGKMYLVSEVEGRVYVYDRDRQFLLKFGEKGGSSGKLSRPRGIGVDTSKGRIYLVDFMRHTITVYNREGKFIFEFGGLGWGEGWFQHPIDIEIDRQSRIIVADMYNHRVQVFNSY